MDPNATLRDMLDAIQDNDRFTLVERAEDLANWIAHGGWIPDVGKTLATWIDNNPMVKT